MAGDSVILKMRAIEKSFSGVCALEKVDFDVRGGEVHALIGENGAGKSTLMNVLAGRFRDYRGEIEFEGEALRITNPRQAMRLGVAVIYQELSVLENFSVAENIMLGAEKTCGPGRRIDRKSIRRDAVEIIEHLGFDLDPDERVSDMSKARQCLVEIAGALRRNAKLLVLDEPTAALGGEDVDRLFRVIEELKSQGLGIVYISHRLAELPRIADRVTVLRDGQTVGTKDIGDCPMHVMSEMMLGHSLAEVFPTKTNEPGRVVLAVEALTRQGAFEDVSFELREGEILGIAGLVGSGRTELARAIFGADKSRGTIAFMGETLRRRSPRSARNVGIGLLPENRKTEGNITGRSVAENINITTLGQLSGAMGFQSPSRLAGQAREFIERIGVDPPNPGTEIQNLSGGNQQKVIVGRWLAAKPKVLIFDEPTQGIDIGTKAQIYELIVNLAEQGCGVILISSELIEVAKLSDRILVMRGGRVVEEIAGPLGDHDVDGLFEACVKKEVVA